MGEGSCVHQWLGGVYSFLIFSQWSLIYWWLEYAHSLEKKKDKKEKEINKKNALICFVYDILLHQALMSSFEGCLLGICIIEGSCEKTKIKKEKKTHYYVCIWYLAPLGTYVIFWGLFIGYIHHWGFMLENKKKERKKESKKEEKNGKKAH